MQPAKTAVASLQHEFIHNLSTIPFINNRDNLWVICGANPRSDLASHIVDFQVDDIS
jgi:hypothetical protein